jgi:L-seryl-tRNA(Ser) seleniumtransferase
MVNLRSLPSVDQLLQTSQASELTGEFGRNLTVKAVRMILSEVRSQAEASRELPGRDELLARVGDLLKDWTSSSLVSVINATGVLLQTNLGRAPLSQSALNAIHEVALGYSNLEYDLFKGQRGSRLIHAEELLRQLTSAEAALVVNNNAAAVLLILTALAKRRGVVISRSQLVEIGGGFRVPDVMKESGARLVEIGTTNRVHLSDYEQALEESKIALIMRVHRSNFRMIGFTSEPTIEELAQAAHRGDVLFIDDLGSGSLVETTQYGLGHEPTLQESLDAGADLVCFSGDKLLGGPQAGIIIGRADLIARLKKHPLARALRADKLCLAALSATLLHYLKGEEEREIPIWRMIAAPLEQLQQRAQCWQSALGVGSVISGQSTVGGGSLPGEYLPTSLLSLNVPSPNRFLARLRQSQPPIIARLQDDQVVFDPRTVLAEQEATLLKGVGELLEK